MQLCCVSVSWIVLVMGYGDEYPPKKQTTETSPHVYCVPYHSDKIRKIIKLHPRLEKVTLCEQPKRVPPTRVALCHHVIDLMLISLNHSFCENTITNQYIITYQHGGGNHDSNTNHPSPLRRCRQRLIL